MKKELKRKSKKEKLFLTPFFLLVQPILQTLAFILTFHASWTNAPIIFFKFGLVFAVPTIVIHYTLHHAIKTAQKGISKKQATIIHAICQLVQLTFFAIYFVRIILKQDASDYEIPTIYIGPE